MRAFLLSMILLAPFSLASHTPMGRCEGNPSMGIIELGGPYGTAPIFYLDDRNAVTGNNIWLYEESNGVYAGRGDPAHNLQRGGTSPIFPDDVETCVDGTWPADTLII